jgi:hypothetical protein
MRAPEPPRLHDALAGHQLDLPALHPATKQ